MREIFTPRLRMVPVREKNAQTLWLVLQQPDLRDFQDLPDLNAQEFRRSIAARPAELAPGAIGRFEWLLFWSAQNDGSETLEALGWVSLRVAQRSPESAEIGYSVVREARGRGVATEAVAGLVSEAFERARLRNVRAFCVPENGPSRTVLLRNGFHDEGVARHGATVQGHAVDVVAYCLSRSDWKAQRRAFTLNPSTTRS